MKKSRKRWVALGLMGLLIWRAWPALWVFSRLNLRVSDDPLKIALVAPPDSQPTLALGGLSHPFSNSGEFWKELLFQPRRIVHGHAFSPRSLDRSRTAAIASILAGKDAFEPWGGEKLCGGFHADYYLRWNQDGKTWEALVCLGCHEALLFHEGESVRCDLAGQTADRISGLDE